MFDEWSFDVFDVLGGWIPQGELAMYVVVLGLLNRGFGWF